MEQGRRLALYGKSRQDENLAGIARFMSEAVRMGFGLMCHEKFASYLAASGFPVESIPPEFSGIPEAEAAVSFGGDGTFLRTARRLGASRIPIAGVNTGSLGYLAHFSLDNPTMLLEGILSGTLDRRPRKLITVKGKPYLRTLSATHSTR